MVHWSPFFGGKKSLPRDFKLGKKGLKKVAMCIIKRLDIYKY
tara:strand:- start:439 stop:564 length:126 start_codon:yes stop_codon:yes gene_type:complete